MAKPQPFAITLSCAYSHSPGYDWSAKIGFRPTRYGFSMWSIGSGDEGDDDVTSRVGQSREKLSWRTACQLLLKQDGNMLGGDLRDEVEVSGADGWRAELLVICWMRDDEILPELKLFLVSLPDDELQWLVEALDGTLTSDSSLSLLSRYLAIASIYGTPRAHWDGTMFGDSSGNFGVLVKHIEAVRAAYISGRPDSPTVGSEPPDH